MILFYNLGIRLYYLVVLLASVFNKKAKLWIKGRKGALKKIEEKIDLDAEYVWFHVSSLGEFEQGRPIVEKLKREYAELKVILTFFSPSGYEVRKNYEHADIISYLPLDTAWNAKRFVQLVQPKWTFFVKYEYWYHFLKQTQKSGSKLFLVSGIFRESQLFFKRYGGWYRKMLQMFDYLFVQNEASGSLLKSIGIENVEVAGDTRFDRVSQIARQSKDIEVAEMFAKGSKVLVCGSTWGPDEDLLVKYINVGTAGLKFIIAPHEIKKEKIDALKARLTVGNICYSEANSENVLNVQVLIIDNIGMLSAIYKYGQMAYIGGGFGAGIHNVLEAAVYGIPVVFGPKHTRFHEALALLRCGGATCISDYQTLETTLNTYISDSEKLGKDSKAAAGYVLNSTGATKAIFCHLKAGL